MASATQKFTFLSMKRNLPLEGKIIQIFVMILTLAKETSQQVCSMTWSWEVGVVEE
jgi:hypothetical protein